MEGFLRHALLRRFLVLLIVGLVFSVSCKKEETASRQEPTGRVVNPYSSESVFEELKKKLQENPDDADALYHLADLYDRNAQYREAIDAYQKVIRLKPDMGYAYLKMGTAYDRIDQPKEAINAFRKAIRYMPNYAVAYNNLAVAHGKLGNYDEEISALQKAIALRPSYTAARYNLGVTYLRKGNRKAALRECESLKKFDEGAAESLMKEIKKGSS